MSLKGKKILIIDDELFVRKVVATVMEKNGCFVYSASNGKDALAKAESYAPDLVITDLMMPNMNGLELCIKLKKIDHKVQVLVLSAHVTKSVLQRLSVLGITAVLIKPFEMEDLLARVQKMIGEDEQPES